MASLSGTDGTGRECPACPGAKEVGGCISRSPRDWLRQPLCDRPGRSKVAFVSMGLPPLLIHWFAVGTDGTTAGHVPIVPVGRRDTGYTPFGGCPGVPTTPHPGRQFVPLAVSRPLPEPRGSFLPG
jgi:hypothetical protein